jgi:uncharacterized membrane protein
MTSTFFLIPAAIIAVLSIPMILRKVPPNPIYGFRTASTLADSVVWYRANAFAGWALLIGAIVGGTLTVSVDAIGLWGPIAGVVAFVLPLCAAVVASFVYLRAIRRSDTRK